jgi:hypothetical protein
VTRGQGTHPAQVLDQDQLRLQAGQGIGVQGVQIAAGCQLPVTYASI